MDFNDPISLLLIAYGLMQAVMWIFSIVGFFSWRLWPVPIAWFANKILRRQWGVIEISGKGNKVITYLASFSKEYFEKDNRFFNLAAAKEQNLVYSKYGVPTIHFDENDMQPKPFHPNRETDVEKQRNSASASNMFANLTTFYKRMAFALSNSRERLIILMLGGAILIGIVQVFLLMQISGAQGNQSAALIQLLENTGKNVTSAGGLRG